MQLSSSTAQPDPALRSVTREFFYSFVRLSEVTIHFERRKTWQ